MACSHKRMIAAPKQHVSSVLGAAVAQQPHYHCKVWLHPDPKQGNAWQAARCMESKTRELPAMRIGLSKPPVHPFAVLNPSCACNQQDAYPERPSVGLHNMHALHGQKVIVSSCS